MYKRQESGSLAEKAFSIVSEEFPSKQYGVDWVNIGYKPGGEVVLQKMVSSMYEACVGVEDVYKRQILGSMGCRGCLQSELGHHLQGT